MINQKTALKQFGNAVPTNVVYHLMKSIIEYGVFSEKQRVVRSYGDQLQLI